MTPDAYLCLTIGGLLVATAAAIGGKVLQEFSRHELEVYCRLRKQRERFGEVLDAHEQVALGAETLYGIAIALYLVAGTLWATSSSAGSAPLEWPALV